MRDLAAAGIAGDDAEFRAEHVVQQQRQVVGGGARIARADDQLLVEHILERLHRGVAAHVADIDVAVGAAEIDELARIVRHRHVAQQRLQHGAGEDRADRRCRPSARPNRCSPPRGWSRRRSCSARRRSDCPGSRSPKCRAKQPRIGVVAAAGRRADDDRDLLALDRIARRIPARAATVAAVQKGGNRGGGKPDAKPDRHRTGSRVPSRAAASSPADRSRPGGFQAGLPLSTAPDFRHGIIAAGCGRGCKRRARLCPPLAATRGRRRSETNPVGEDHDRLLWIDQPERAEDFHHARGERAPLQFQAGGRLGQRAARRRNSPSSTRTRKSR